MPSQLVVRCFSTSTDGYGAGPSQDIDNPMGAGGMALHEWVLPTEFFQKKLFGKDGGTTGPDNDFAVRGFENIGAWILGRNMFGPVRGPWPDDSWRGWWGDEPPYDVPVFVLTRYARPDLVMEGGTTFHFITGGMVEALDRAREAAGSRHVRIGGGVNTIRQYFAAGLIDEAHFAVSPVLIGSGEHMYAGLDLPSLGYAVRERVEGERATHLRIARV